MPTRRRLEQAAIAISILSVLYNGAEGGVSIGLGAESGSRALIFFGVQSFVEIMSAMLVIYRFRNIGGDGKLSAKELGLERRATLSIGVLFIILTISTWIVSSIALAEHHQPDTALPSLIISASAIACMIAIWLPKVYLYKKLNSSAMKAEADCSLACIALTTVLLIGSIIYQFWENGWWVDSAVSLILGCFFAKQGVEMIRWARDPMFDGGCCGSCAVPQIKRCDCCQEKEKCRIAEKCMCDEEDACSCLSEDGTCCDSRDVGGLQLTTSKTPKTCSNTVQNDPGCCKSVIIAKELQQDGCKDGSCCSSGGAVAQPDPTTCSNTIQIDSNCCKSVDVVSEPPQDGCKSSMGSCTAQTEQVKESTCCKPTKQSSCKA